MFKKNFYIITLGCKVNQYESQAVRECWLQAGHIEINSPQNADLVLINSCAITAKAVSDLRAAARRVRRAAPGCELLITGCAAQSIPEELEELDADSLIPQQEKVKLLRWPGIVDENRPAAMDFKPHAQVAIDDEFWVHEGPEEHIVEDTTGFPSFSISSYARSRPVLKIHDGCSQHCTYCIVPLSRGASVSRPWPEILAEAGRLVQAGFREIVLNGVNLRQYGADLPQKEDFWDLLVRLESALAPEWGSDEAKETGNFLRFRISSLEPGQCGSKALDVLGNSKLVAPHLHLSLQSCSQAVLKRMGRGHYNPEILPDFLQQLSEIWPTFALGADFIAGFPGESVEQFAETLSISKVLPLTYAHVFPYSSRPGTVAARLPDQLDPSIKKERAARLRNLVEEKKKNFLKLQAGLESLWIAVEEEKPGHGINEYYVDCEFIKPPAAPYGRIIKARPTGLCNGRLQVQEL